MDATSRQKIASLERRIRELEDKHESGGVKESLAKSAGDNEIRLRRLELAVQATKDGVWDWDILNKRIWQSAPNVPSMPKRLRVWITSTFKNRLVNRCWPERSVMRLIRKLGQS